MDLGTVSRLVVTGASITCILATAPVAIHRTHSTTHRSKIQDGFVPITWISPPPLMGNAPTDSSVKLALAAPHGPRATKAGLTFEVHFSGDTLPDASSNTQLVAYAVYDDSLEWAGGGDFERVNGSVSEIPGQPGHYEYLATFSDVSRGVPRQVIFTMKQLGDQVGYSPYAPDVDTYVWDRPY